MGQQTERYGDALLAACPVCKVSVKQWCMKTAINGLGKVSRDIPHKLRERAGAKVRAKIMALPALKLGEK